MPKLNLYPGAMFAKSFRIVAGITRSGMGTIYEVDHLPTGRRQALKVLSPLLYDDIDSRERFEREAKISGQIESEHVVQVFDYGVEPGSLIPWISMELLEGEDLADILTREGRLSFTHVLPIFEQLRHGLTAAHKRGVLHLDLKPDNLFLARTRRRTGVPILKVLDFGISRQLSLGRLDSTVNITLGSPLWSAPEQISRGAKVSAAADVWTLGLLAFYLLVGEYYWLDPDPERIPQELLCGEPFVPASVRAAELCVEGIFDEELDAWFSRCVRLSPEARYRDAAEAIPPLLRILSQRCPPEVRELDALGLDALLSELLVTRRAPLRSMDIDLEEEDWAIPEPDSIEGVVEQLSHEVPTDQLLQPVSAENLRASASEERRHGKGASVMSATLPLMMMVALGTVVLFAAPAKLTAWLGASSSPVTALPTAQPQDTDEVDPLEPVGTPPSPLGPTRAEPELQDEALPETSTVVVSEEGEEETAEERRARIDHERLVVRYYLRRAREALRANNINEAYRYLYEGPRAELLRSQPRSIEELGMCIEVTDRTRDTREWNRANRELVRQTRGWPQRPRLVREYWHWLNVQCSGPQPDRETAIEGGARCGNSDLSRH